MRLNPTLTGWAKVLTASLGLVACTEHSEWSGSLEHLLRSQADRFGTVMQDPEKHRLQIIYTQIDRDVDNRPSFTSYRYRLDSGEYFYPASTVKLPTALLALEKLNGLDIKGLDRNSTMLTGAVRNSQIAALEDLSSSTGLPSVGHYIRKILLVSDNDAFNRLYEFLGQEQLNEALRAKGLKDTRIMHRLEIALSVEENRHTNPIRFVDRGVVLFEQDSQYSGTSFVGETPVRLGQAEVIDGKLQKDPKDFAEKNAFPLQDLHDVVQALMFPDSVSPDRRFDLTLEDYQFVYRNMSTYPVDSGIYSDRKQYPDGFVKFLMFGGAGNEIPNHVRIFNKVGDAYGFLTDAAYIIDLENSVEFILAATIYANENETFNDNVYEYDEIGLPFLRDLGAAIHEVELNRERKHAPDLSRFADLK
ncbi:MAG: serine hydrolase [Woeseiaceae bacterium]